MIFDPNALIRLARTLGKLSNHPKGRSVHHMGDPEGLCGRCPGCREIVVLEHLDPVAGTPCPRCGRHLGRLDPLVEETPG
jgi:uncharacterized paraquat-inducible protein A